LGRKAFPPSSKKGVPLFTKIIRKRKKKPHTTHPHTGREAIVGGKGGFHTLQKRKLVALSLSGEKKGGLEGHKGGKGIGNKMKHYISLGRG